MNPPGAAARDSGADPQALMSIGEVLARLRAEFPDATISKLRFLEAEGLVAPLRTASGYRKYSARDVARLRFVLGAQRDQFLPLRVIREQLAASDADGQPPPGRPALAAVGEPDETGTASEPALVRVDRAGLIARTGVTEDLLAELERLTLVTLRPPGWYDADAVIVVEAAVGLAGYGLEPRHLRAFRAAADRELGLFGQLLAPLVRQRDPAARARAEQTARELTGLARQLHSALVRTGLRDTLGR